MKGILQTSESYNHHPVTHPASLQPVSETTTSESSVSLPSSPSGSSSTESTSTSGTDSSSSSSETSSKSSSQPSSYASSPETTSASSSWTMSPELLEKECYFNTLLTDTREKQGHAITRSQMDNLREQQHITVLKQVTMQPQNQGLSEHLQQQTCHSPHIPEDVQVTWGLGTGCRQRMPMLPTVRTTVTQKLETDCKTLTRSLEGALDLHVSRS